MYFSKVNIYHDKLYEDKQTPTNKSRVCTDKKEKYNYMEAERKTGPKKYHYTNDRKRKKS